MGVTDVYVGQQFYGVNTGRNYTISKILEIDLYEYTAIDQRGTTSKGPISLYAIKYNLEEGLFRRLKVDDDLLWE